MQTVVQQYRSAASLRERMILMIQVVPSIALDQMPLFRPRSIDQLSHPQAVLLAQLKPDQLFRSDIAQRFLQHHRRPR